MLRLLPAGTLVDGELVAFDAAGRADLRQLLRRHGLTDLWRIRQAQQWCLLRYVLFDLLYRGGRWKAPNSMPRGLVQRDATEATNPVGSFQTWHTLARSSRASAPTFAAKQRRLRQQLELPTSRHCRQS